MKPLLLPIKKQNSMQIEAKARKGCGLSSHLININAVILATRKRQRLPNPLVHVTEKGEFYIAIENTNVIPKAVGFSDLSVEP